MSSVRIAFSYKLQSEEVLVRFSRALQCSVLIKFMKKPILHLSVTTALAFASIGLGHAVLGQASVQTITSGQGTVQTTTSAGTISEFSPQTIVVKTEQAADPVRYTYTKSMTYVDDEGNPVSMETVKSGLPVTVYYVKDGDNLVASKVIVRRSVTVPAPHVQESKTTTTTTTDK